jgi:hypothetical protein
VDFGPNAASMMTRRSPSKIGSTISWASWSSLWASGRYRYLSNIDMDDKHRMSARRASNLLGVLEAFHLPRATEELNRWMRWEGAAPELRMKAAWAFVSLADPDADRYVADLLVRHTSEPEWRVQNPSLQFLVARSKGAGRNAALRVALRARPQGIALVDENELAFRELLASDAVEGPSRSDRLLQRRRSLSAALAPSDRVAAEERDASDPLGSPGGRRSAHARARLPLACRHKSRGSDMEPRAVHGGRRRSVHGTPESRRATLGRGGDSAPQGPPSCPSSVARSVTVSLTQFPNPHDTSG